MPLNLPTTSRYRFTNVVQHKGQDTLGVWPGYKWIDSPPAQTIVVSSVYAGRANLLAKDYLGASDLWWVLVYYNKVKDINWPRAGDVVSIPDPALVLIPDASQSGANR